MQSSLSDEYHNLCCQQESTEDKRKKTSPDRHADYLDATDELELLAAKGAGAHRPQSAAPRKHPPLSDWLTPERSKQVSQAANGAL